MQVIKHIVFFVLLCPANLVHAGVWAPIAAHGDRSNGVMPFVEADSADFPLFDTPDFSSTLPASALFLFDSAAIADTLISRPVPDDLAIAAFPKAKRGVFFRGAQTDVEPPIFHLSIPVISDYSASEPLMAVNNPAGTFSNKALPQLAWMLCGAMMGFLFLERPKKTDTLTA